MYKDIRFQDAFYALGESPNKWPNNKIAEWTDDRMTHDYQERFDLDVDSVDSVH